MNQRVPKLYPGGYVALAVLALWALPASVMAGQIHEAAREGNLAKVKELVAAEPGLVAEPGEWGMTPLHMAAAADQREVAIFLLESGADPNARNAGERSVLHRPATEGYAEMIGLLAARGADPNAQERWGNAPLHWAVDRGHEGAVRALIDSGADVDIQNLNGHTPLHVAAEKGQTAIAGLLIECGADAERSSANGGTPLHLAAEFGHADVVGLLLKNGARLDARNLLGWTPLHAASARGRGDVVARLLAAGADVRAADLSGATPLHWSARASAVAVMSALLDNAASVKATDARGRTALHFAAESWGAESAVLLLARGAAPTARDNLGRTPLHVAAHWGRDLPAGALIERGADIEAVDRAGRTALHLAAAQGHVHTVRALMALEAKADASDGRGRTPLHWAALTGHTDTAIALLDAEVDAGAQDADGRTAMELARRANRTETAGLLELWSEGGGDEETSDAVVIRVGAYNVEFGAKGTAEQIGEMFKPYELDVIGFNEVPGGDWTARVGQVLGMPHAFVGSISSAGHKDKYKSILSRTPLQNPAEFVVEGQGWRPASVVRAEAVCEGLRVAIYSLHICHHEHTQGGQAYSLAHDVLGTETVESVLVMGDFNHTISNAGMREVLEAGYRPAWADLDLDLDRVFTIPSRQLTPEEEADWGGAVIDHILYSRASGAHATDGGIIELEQPLSDHKPIWAQVVVPR